MKKILCPTDFTDAGNNAIAFAAKLAQKAGLHLDLINVQSLAAQTPEGALMGEEINAQMAYDRLEAISRDTSRIFKISCNARVATSITGISNMIEREASGYALIVMGTNGEDSLYDFFFGSHAYHVAKHTSLPVIVVPFGCVYANIGKSVFAYDYWRNNTLPHEQIGNVLQSLESELIVLQVLEKSYSERAELEMKGDQQMILEAFGNQLPISFDSIHTDHIADALDHYMKENKADLLVLCTQHQSFIDRLFHKSVIRQMSRIATYPLMVVHR